METFMADFSLDDLGAIEFKEFGEETNVFIRKQLWPTLFASQLWNRCEKVSYRPALSLNGSASSRQMRLSTWPYCGRRTFL
jgi:hypothetical protein